MDFKVNCQVHLSTFVSSMMKFWHEQQEKISSRKIEFRLYPYIYLAPNREKSESIFFHEEDKRMAVTIGWRIKKKKKDNNGKN